MAENQKAGTPAKTGSPESIEPNLQEIIDVIAEAVETGIKQLKDGFQYTDIFQFIPVLSKIPEAIKDANKAWEYLQDMDATKRQELIDAVVAKLQTEDAREWATKIIDTLASAYMLIKFIMSKAKPAAAEGDQTENNLNQPQ